MAEEHEFQSPEGHRLCVNNCGFFGSPTTQNMCSKCYDLTLKNFSAPLTASTPSSAIAAAQPCAATEISTEKAPAVAATVAQPTAGRCSSCRKKVGLTGFRCRCGTTFCGTHRYPEKHACTFDFKAMGREAIAKANPVVKGVKLEKI